MNIPTLLTIDTDDELTCLKRFHNLYNYLVKRGKVINYFDNSGNIVRYSYIVDDVTYSMIFRLSRGLMFVRSKGDQTDEWLLEYTDDWFALRYDGGTLLFTEAEFISEFEEFVCDYGDTA